jgi:hypothetical protein
VRRKLPAEAFDVYVGLGIGRSYQQVAQHYGVSKGTVTAMAKKDDWQRRLVRVEEKARSRADEKAVETLEQVNDRHLKIARALQGKALDALRSLPLEDAKDAIRALDLGVKQERVIMGEPNERSAVSVESKIEREYERWMENGRG